MVNKCCVVGCRSNYKGEEIVPVFSFPSNEDIKNSWIKFVNRKDWQPTSSAVICIKHFESRFLKKGKHEKRFRLINTLKPIPTIYPEFTKTSSMSTVTLPRKSPKKRVFQEDQYDEFKRNNNIIGLESINESDCPSGYVFTKYEDHVVFHKVVLNDLHVPEVTGCIRVDNKLHVKLFLKGLPVPLPQWFRYGHNCTLISKSMLENFPTYLESQEENFSIFDELKKRQFKKNLVYSSEVIQYALLLRYTSLQSYKLLLDEFPLPSISLLNKIKEGNIDALKAAKLLLDNGSISKNIVLLFDEMFLQKCVEYCGGEVFGLNDSSELYKSIVCFMIIGLKENVPYVVKATPVTSINSELLKTEILTCLELLITSAFNVRAIICDNHAANVSTFTKLILQFGVDRESLFITFQSQKIYLFYDTVHLIKNVRNNLLSKKRLVFPQFSFFDFTDDVIVDSGEISWKLLHNVHEKDRKLDANFKKAPKLTNKVLHPGKFKQNVQIALDIFHETTAAAITSYFPNCNDAVGFLKLFNTWWTISNSKDQYCFGNYLGRAAIKNDSKPEFLREMAAWLKRWENTKIPNCEKFTFSAQTSSALQRTLLCQASLIEDLLLDGFNFVLTSRFQSDPIERRFGQYRQMSGGRFLVGLKDVTWSERILKIKSLVKESIDIVKDNIKVTENEDVIQQEFFDDIVEINFVNVKLSEETREVAAHISGYIAKKLVKKFGQCCKIYSIHESETEPNPYGYIDVLSRGGLTLPSECLVTYVSDCFAYIDHAINFIISSKMKERIAAQYLLDIVMFHEPFLCCMHWSAGQKMTHSMIANIYFNNKRKIMTDIVHKDNVVSFKKRQREK